MNVDLDSGEIIMSNRVLADGVLSPHATDIIFWILVIMCVVVVFYPLVKKYRNKNIRKT